MINRHIGAVAAEVNAAITAILVGGQSYKIGSRSLTRANLAELKKMRDELEAAVTPRGIRR